MSERSEAVRALVRVSRLLERAAPDLSLPHYRVLAAIASGDERASGVAARLALGKPTISASVDALCRRGLVVREDIVTDHRAAALRVTADGAAVLAATEAAMTNELDAVLGHTDRAAEIVEALAALGAGLDAAIAERSARRAAR